MNTPIRRLSGENFKHFVAYIKDESLNTYGTVKDRRNRCILTDAMRFDVDKLVLITAGSNGYSLAKLAGNSAKVVAIVDFSVSREVKSKLRGAAHRLVEIDLQSKILLPEEVIALARENDNEVIWDVTNGYEDSYGSIISELQDLSPDYVVVPIGSGGLYVGLVGAIQRSSINTRVIGIGVQKKSDSLADKLHTPWTPYEKTMQRLQRQGNPIYRLTESEVEEVWRQYQHTCTLEPSSSVVFAAISKKKFLPTDIVVFVNTGQLEVVAT